MTIVEKAALAARVWATYLQVRRSLRAAPLAIVVDSLGRTRPVERRSVGQLSRAVSRALRLGPATPRCLTRSLVLYRLLREQGDEAELVIGLPTDATTWEAHAWVEVGGIDVGPYPGRQGRQEIVRYPPRRPADQ